MVNAVAMPQPLNDYSKLDKNQKKLADKAIEFSSENTTIVNLLSGKNPKIKNLAFEIKKRNSGEIKKVTFIYLRDIKDRYSVTKDLKEKKANIVIYNYKILATACQRNSILYNEIIKKGGEIEWIYIYNQSLSNSFSITVNKETCERARKFFNNIK